ncbi:MAG: MFS transporter [Limnochordaceae bacterium]|nr:MFS transporter [Limnochordaceae bacterium]
MAQLETQAGTTPGQGDAVAKNDEAGSPPGRTDEAASGTQAASTPVGGSRAVESRQGWTLAILCLVPFIMVLGNSLLIPILPELQRALHISPARAGLLITVFSFPAGLIIPFSGFLSDQWGRRVVMAPALVMYGLGGLVAGIAGWLLGEKAWGWVLTGRVLQGVGAGGTYQLAMAMVGDTYTGSRRPWALGLLEAANGLGKVVAPLVGAATGLIIWFLPFFVYGVLALPAAALLWWVAQERPPAGQPPGLGEYFHNLTGLFRQKGLALAINYAAGFLVLGTLFGVLSFVSDRLGATTRWTLFSRGLILAIPVAVMALASYIIGTVLQKRLQAWVHWLVPVGLVLVAAGCLLYLLVSQPAAQIAVVAGGVGLGTGLTLPAVNTLVTSAAPRRGRGVVTSVYGTLRFFGVAAGPPLFGAVPASRPWPAFVGAAAALGAVALLSALVVQEETLLDSGAAPAGAGGSG